ncbi:aspartyl protease family protein [Phenylobacterium sp.]|uniref:aspartyl protease family protein n=1 Tax=Phenylobacterium sp. TaxID=1871053 RepID=UPI002730F8C0|nr:aspartyl protease family protein [Phenylobacterium sp.]MDP2214404.1 aspartyl protease family protein [Phenylobacterium sp.]
MIARAALLACGLAAWSGGARAAEIACWLDRGVLVAPATAAGVSGDFIIDTGADHSAIHNTRAQAAGHEGEAMWGEVSLAGARVAAQDLAVEDLDARTWAFPTPIAGVIGADILRGFVVELDTSPCRLTLALAGALPRPAGPGVPISWMGATPVVSVAISDGPTARTAALTPATGLDAGVRLSPAIAAVPGAEAKTLSPYEDGRAELRALSLGGALFEHLRAGLSDEAATSDGAVGLEVLGRWRLRFDFPGGRLHLISP